MSGDFVRGAEKQNEILGEAPKDFSLVDVIRQNWQLSAKIDQCASLV
jgi:hypothetical protein